MNNILCWTCGLVQQSPLPESQSELDRRQAEHVEWRYARRGVSEIYAISDEATRKQSSRLDPFLQNVLDKPGLRVLDIGCGLGGLLAYVTSHYGALAQGIEMDRFEAEFVSSQRDFTVDVQHIEPWLETHRNEKFSLVILSHVLEHLGDPVDVLKKLKQVLCETGGILIEVPNILHPAKDPELYFKPSHLWNFTPRSLAAVIEKSGLKIAMCSGPNTSKLIALVKATTIEPKHPTEGSVAAVCLRWAYMHIKSVAKKVLGYKK